MYRSAAFLDELFGVIQRMSPLPAEIVLLDDASPDNSLQVAQRFRDSFSHKVPIKVLANQRNLGIAAAYNRLTEESRESWIHILDADDYPVEPDFYARVGEQCLPGVDTVVAALQASSTLLAGGNRLFGNLVPLHPPRWMPLLGSFATRSGVLYRRERLVANPFPDPAYPGSDVIHLLGLRSARNCSFVRHAHVYYRIHAGASSSQARNFDCYREQLRKFDAATRLSHELDLSARRAGQYLARK